MTFNMMTRRTRTIPTQRRALLILAILVCAACRGDAPTQTAATIAHDTSTAPPSTTPKAITPAVTLPVLTFVTPQTGDSVSRYAPHVTVRVVSGTPVHDVRVFLAEQGADPQLWFGSIGSLPAGSSVANYLATTVPAGAYSLVAEAVDSAGNVGRSAPAQLVFVEPDTTARIAVVAATVIELQYPGLDHWFYAPQVTVLNPSNVSDLRVTGFDMLTIPGLVSPFPSVGYCPLTVHHGQSAEIFREIYGDWEVTYDAGDGHRSSGGTATMRVTYQDEAGHIYAATVHAPIVSGELPTTYTGGRWRC